MYDVINSLAAGIARQFPNVAKVAGDINGIYAWSQAEWNLFPHADHVTISITAAANAGDVLDVEVGDASPNQTAGWIAMRKAPGQVTPPGQLPAPTGLSATLHGFTVNLGWGAVPGAKSYEVEVFHHNS